VLFFRRVDVASFSLFISLLAVERRSLGPLLFLVSLVQREWELFSLEVVDVALFFLGGRDPVSISTSFFLRRRRSRFFSLPGEELEFVPLLPLG